MGTKPEPKDEKFENVISGLERANIKFYQFSLLVLYPRGAWKYYNYIVLFVFEILSVYFIIAGVITIYLQMHNIFAVFEVANALLISLAIFINLADFHVISKRRLLWYRLFSCCRDDLHIYDCESVKTEMARLRSLFRNFMEWFFIIATSGLFSIIILMFIVIPIARFIFDEQQVTKNTAFNIYLPLPWWSIFSTRTVLGFAVQYSLMLFMAFNIIVIFLVYVSSVLYFMVELIVQFKILCFALTKHEERIEIIKGRTNDRESLSISTKVAQNVVDQVLKETIIHHLKIREFFNMVQEFTSFFFALVLSANMLVIVALSVILTKMDSLMTMEGMKFCLILAVELLHIFCFTYCGSMLIDESSNVREMLYSVHWYSFNSNQKKILNIFQVQTESTFMLSASGIYNINLNMFLQIMQTAYSVFNVFSNIKT
ncbi:uncharacterized protein LOC120352534 [Nilaparvata lugens]|uniref:uncharacterized protein LOC120352534 n=1 Tax=Nilaparvata lugens TaxID=108931 RepID=UPI00193D876B|nr:uncharacterized protein LOC120352534 [Nilaparvata lugens]